MAATYPLAFDSDGNPLDVPTGATAWRVRRAGERGRPRPIYNAETGRPLELALEATIDDLIDHGCTTGRYRLEPIDAEGRALPCGFAVVDLGDEPDRAEEEKKKSLDVTAHALAAARDSHAMASQFAAVFCQVLQSLASAFGPLQPARPTPVVIETPAPPAAPVAATADGMKPEQIMQMITTLGPMLGQVFSGLINAAGAASAAPNVGGPA